MRKWHRYVPAVSSVAALVAVVEVLSAAQKW